MAEFVVRLRSPLGARACFAAVADWDAHQAAIPLTRLIHDGEPRVGQRFVARTGVGPVAFDDVMVVQAFVPPESDSPGTAPGVGEVVKTGRVVAGRVRWTVTPVPDGSAVEWAQTLTIPWLPRLLDPIVGLIGRRAYGWALRTVVTRAADDGR